MGSLVNKWPFIRRLIVVPAGENAEQNRGTGIHVTSTRVFVVAR